jgi:hypothetical protein
MFLWLLPANVFFLCTFSFNQHSFSSLTSDEEQKKNQNFKTEEIAISMLIQMKILIKTILFLSFHPPFALVLFHERAFSEVQQKNVNCRRVHERYEDFFRAFNFEVDEKSVRRRGRFCGDLEEALFGRRE